MTARTENDRKELADKIQKLLAKAESTDHDREAEAFREKAEELMEKHSLTGAELESSEFVARNWEPGYSQAPGWYKGLVANLGSFLGVFTAYDSRETGENCVLILGGREEDIEMLQYMTKAIKVQIQDLTEDFRERTNATRADTNAYRLGVVQRVGEKLQSMVENVSDGQSEKALVLVEENKEKQRKGRRAAQEAQGGRFVKGSGASYRSEHARRQGKEDGDKVNVNKGVPSADSNRQITS